MRATRIFVPTGLCAFVLLASSVNTDANDDQPIMGPGIAVLIGSSERYAKPLDQFIETHCRREGTVLYFQSDDPDDVLAARKAATKCRMLGTRVFVDRGPLNAIQLADNVADVVIVGESQMGKVADQEILRVLRPRGKAHVGTRTLTKAVPAGTDEWTHPYHGPDNNPQSNDRNVRGDFRTQFIAEPKFSPMPEQSVVAGGRIYKAMGHIAHKSNQNDWLNTLLCINAYNGTILWKRPLPAGFMIHRNTMIGTDDALLLGDHESCKVIDGQTGKVREEITIPDKLTDGQVWKWMAVRDGVLFALVGNPEIQVDTQRSARRGLGHWPWGMWKGHDYDDPRTAFGFGRTLVAIDLKSKKLRWHYRDDEFLDARGVCMNGNHIYCFSPEKFLACIDIDSGSLLWKNSDTDLLQAVGPPGKAQHYVTGYATTCYMKCNDEHLFFAGPQRTQMVVASANDGRLEWTHPVGNLQLVLRENGIYAAGPQRESGFLLDYATGKELGTLPARRACTRATGCADSIFFRASGGTVRVMTETNTAQHIAPMRPPCQDGVIVSNGHLYWGPWMCGCQLSLYGNICLAALGDSETLVSEAQPDARTIGDDPAQVTELSIQPGDWPTYRGDNARSDITQTTIPARVQLQWKAEICSTELPTAPVAAGSMVFLADRTGTVHAIGKDGRSIWQAYTGGPVYYPPAVSMNRLFVGSADGRVYAFEAATGRRLWTYRVGPTVQRIPVFGKLISRWPVAGGVVVRDGTVYAAAGIAHYDGTFVVALDAVTGKRKASNSTSGSLSKEVNSGISLQGDLAIDDGELRFLAGGVYETARYDLETLECLNAPKPQITSQYRTAFYPYYPGYGKYVSLEHTCSDGTTLCHDASYEGSIFGNLQLQARSSTAAPKTQKEANRWDWLRRRGRQAKGPNSLWQDKRNRRFTSFAVSDDRLLATGHFDAPAQESFLAALSIKDGSDVWAERIPANAVKGGTAIDHQGRIYVALENGELLCFAAVAD